MYAAAKAKQQSYHQTEHFSAPHLVANYKTGREIYAEGDLINKHYWVLTGAVRICRLLSDGRRHVVAFHFPGEMFGLETGSNHSFSAEAIHGNSCRLRAPKEITLCVRLGSATRGYTQVYNLQSALALTWAHRTPHRRY